MVLTPAGPNTCSILAAVGLPEDMLEEPVACSPQRKLAMVLSAEQPNVSEALSADRNADWLDYIPDESWAMPWSNTAPRFAFLSRVHGVRWNLADYMMTNDAWLST